MWPQITFLTLSVFGVLMHAANNGKARDNYSIDGALLSFGIMFWLLWEGGFWHALGWQ
jgi:hypothetical protein